MLKMLAISICAIAMSSAQAMTMKGVDSGVSDFVAPVVPNEASLAEKPVGMIFYDLSVDALKVVLSSGDTAELTLPDSTVPVASAGNERIERGSGTCGSPSSINTSAGWTIGTNTSGTCTISFNGAFSGTPTCTFTGTPAGNSHVYGFNSTPTSSQVQIRGITSGGTNITSYEYHVICMGPR